jgi:predicted GIY-YIG superfamily endonuclease
MGASSKENKACELEQYCAKHGLVFKGFCEEWRGVKTKVSVECTKHGHTWNNTSTYNLLKGVRCPLCLSEERSTSLTQSTALLSNKFMGTGSYPVGTKFFRGSKVNEWYYLCPKCASDKYSLAGLCDGIFRTSNQRLNAGVLSCRCSNTFRWTKAQREFRILSDLKDTKYSFVKWADASFGPTSKILLCCDDHGEFDILLQGFLSGQRCSRCAHGGYKRGSTQGFVYVLLIEGRTGTFCGFGITNNIERRLQQHQLELAKHGYFIVKSSILTTDGQTAFNIEKQIKEKFNTIGVDVKGFKSESIPASEYDNLINFLIEKGNYHEGIIDSKEH